LSSYRWPGNVRELANLIERLAILYPNALVDVQDLPEKYQSQELLVQPPKSMPEAGSAEAALIPRLPRNGIDLKEHLTNLEFNLIQQALDEANWVVAHAAKRLMMGRTTLVEKMRKYGLHRGDDPTGL
jgi:sigma-54 specific flagellar transcriptional regulator A